jgi:regulator of protease activity HflC (stomatin/prohibitin superfamily)
MSWTKEVTAKYPVTEILGDERANMNVALTDYLAAKFEPYGIVIETASLLDINPDEETRQAIQKKVNAQQELELANIEKNTAKVRAEKEKEVAEIDAQQRLVEAQGKAEAMLVEAEAQAQANREIADSLTPELIEQMKYEKWDGVLPYIEGSSTPIVNIGGYNTTPGVSNP